MQQFAIDPSLGKGRRPSATRSPLAGVTDRVLQIVLKTANDNAELADGAVRRAIVDCRAELANAESPAQIGDRVLICLASLFAAGVRSNDLVARLGGEEFALLLRNVSIDKALDRLRQIREKLAATYEYEHEGRSVSVGFTYSCGLTASVPDDTCESVLARADKALYRAKSRGKDRVVVEKRSYPSAGGARKVSI